MMDFTYDDSILCEWTCLKCGHTQTDDYTYTSVVWCSICEAEFEWEDVVSQSIMKGLNKELEIVYAEAFHMAEQERGYA